MFTRHWMRFWKVFILTKILYNTQKCIIFALSNKINNICLKKSEKLRQCINELMSVKARLKIVSFLLKQGVKIDKDELDELLERYKKLREFLNMGEED